jgi:hypothetical protein
LAIVLLLVARESVRPIHLLLIVAEMVNGGKPGAVG